MITRDEKGHLLEVTGYREDTASTGERMLTSLALRVAVDVMTNPFHEWIARDLELATLMINDIRAQRGCEHLNPAVTNGYLTHFIDIVMVG
jgi:hypothetical protein